MASKTVRDRQGYVLYTVSDSGKQKQVSDRTGRSLGFLMDGKTYDPQGRLVSDGESPGLLLT